MHLILSIITKKHKNELLGFCKECKNLICEKCIDNNLHKNHIIDYTKDLEITEEIIQKYEINLKKAFFEINNLLKAKYDFDKIKFFEMKNLYEEKGFDYYSFKFKDQQILKSLELLKTFLDLYKSHKNKNRNYQIMMNVLNHANFEILSIKNQDKLNKNTDITFKINLKMDKESDKLLKIISFKRILFKSIQNRKIIDKKNERCTILFYNSK